MSSTQHTSCGDAPVTLGDNRSATVHVKLPQLVELCQGALRDGNGTASSAPECCFQGNSTESCTLNAETCAALNLADWWQVHGVGPADNMLSFGLLAGIPAVSHVQTFKTTCSMSSAL